MISFFKKHWGDLFVATLLIFVISKQIPVWANSYQQLGKMASNSKTFLLDGTPTQVPDLENKRVYIFWATWCKPCHLQLGWFKKAVNKGKLNKQDIIAVNLSEPIETVKKFQEEHQYPFSVVIAPEKSAWKEFNVVATPTIAYIEKGGTIKDFSSGLAPLAVYRSPKFLKSKN